MLAKFKMESSYAFQKSGCGFWGEDESDRGLPGESIP